MCGGALRRHEGEREAPEVFRLQTNGRLAYRAHVPADAADRVIRAVEVCPARAIGLRRLPTTVLTPDTGLVPQITPTGVPPAPRATSSTETALRTGGLPIFPPSAGRQAPPTAQVPAGQPVRMHRGGRGR